MPPLCVAYVVDYANDPSSASDVQMFLTAGAMLLAPITVAICNHNWYHLVMLDGLHARTAIQAAVYSKALRLSNAARTRSSAQGGVADTIINLQSTDCRSIEVAYWMWSEYAVRHQPPHTRARAPWPLRNFRSTPPRFPCRHPLLVYVWAAPLQVVVTTVLMYLQVGWCVFLGIAVLFLMGPIQQRLMKTLKRLNKVASESSDARIKVSGQD